MKVRHTIHEVATLLGISTDTIRLYEKEGLVTPLRNPDNGYRYYETDQIQRIMGVYLYRQINVSIPEIKSIVNASSFSDVCERFSEFIRNREAKIQKLQNEIEKLHFMQGHLKRLSSGVGICRLENLPAAYILYQQDSAEILYPELKMVLNAPSFSFGNFCYTLSQNSGARYETSALRFLVREPMMALSGANTDNQIFPIQPSCPCLYTVYSFPSTRTLDWNLDVIFDYANTHGYQCSSEGYAYYVYSLTQEDEITDFYEVYLPII